MPWGVLFKVWISNDGVSRDFLEEKLFQSFETKTVRKDKHEKFSRLYNFIVFLPERESTWWPNNS